MELDSNENIVVQTLAEGHIVANAANIPGDGIADSFHSIRECDLPITLCKMATNDVLDGLREVVRAGVTIENVTLAHALSCLAELGVAASVQIAEAG